MDIELHSPLRGSKVNIWYDFLAKAGLAAQEDAQHDADAGRDQADAERDPEAAQQPDEVFALPEDLKSQIRQSNVCEFLLICVIQNLRSSLNFLRIIKHAQKTTDTYDYDT